MNERKNEKCAGNQGVNNHSQLSHKSARGLSSPFRNADSVRIRRPKIPMVYRVSAGFKPGKDLQIRNKKTVCGEIWKRACISLNPKQDSKKNATPKKPR
jgi:hypothetical protein